MALVEMILPTAETVRSHEAAWRNMGRLGVPMLALCHLLLQAVASDLETDPSLDEHDMGDLIAGYLVNNTVIDPTMLPVEDMISIRAAAYDLYRTLRKLRHLLVGAEGPGVCLEAIQQTSWVGKDMVVAIRTTEPGGYRYHGKSH